MRLYMAGLLAAAALSALFACAGSGTTVVKEPEETEPKMAPASRTNTDEVPKYDESGDDEIRVDEHPED